MGEVGMGTGMYERSVESVDPRRFVADRIVELRSQENQRAERGQERTTEEKKGWIEAKQNWVEQLLFENWEGEGLENVLRMKIDLENRLENGGGGVFPEQEVTGMMAEAIAMRVVRRVLMEHVYGATGGAETKVTLGGAQTVDLDMNGIDIEVRRLLYFVGKTVRSKRVFISVKGRANLKRDHRKDVDVVDLEDLDEHVNLNRRYHLSGEDIRRSINAGRGSLKPGEVGQVLMLGLDTSNIADLLVRAEKGELDDLVREGLEKTLGIELMRRSDLWK